MGYSTSAIKGISWNGLLKIVSTGVSAARIIFLARLLSPSDFGLASLAFIALGITESFTETGINVIIVQSKKELSYFLDTAWVIAIFRGLAIGCVMLLLSFPLSYFFGNQQLFLLIALTAVVPVIKGFINPAIVQLQKELRFFHDTLYRFTLVFFEAVTAIVLAFLFRSVFVFIIAMILSALAEVLLSFLLLKSKPAFQYLPSRGKEIFSQMKHLNLSSIFGYLIQNIDNFLIGKVLGTSLLGFYANGYAVSHRVNMELSKSVIHGTFPVYVRISDDMLRLRKAFFKTIGISIGTFIILGLPFFFFPQQVVQLLLGEKWAPVAAFLPILVVAGIIQSVFTIITPLLYAKKIYQWLNLGLLVNCVLLVCLIFIFSNRYGLMGAAWGVLLARVFALPFALLGAKKALYEPATK